MSLQSSIIANLASVQADMNYLANLCHNCSECLHACQYAPPHPFFVNVPKTLAQIRVHTYEQYCWPQALGFAGNVEAAFTDVPEGDLVLLRCDAEATPGWLSRRQVIPRSQLRQQSP